MVSKAIVIDRVGQQSFGGHPPLNGGTYNFMDLPYFSLFPLGNRPSGQWSFSSPLQAGD